MVHANIKLPFACSSPQDVHKEDDHHKKVDDKSERQDIIPEKESKVQEFRKLKPSHTYHLEEEMILSTMPALLHWDRSASTTRWESP